MESLLNEIKFMINETKAMDSCVASEQSIYKKIINYLLVDVDEERKKFNSDKYKNYFECLKSILDFHVHNQSRMQIALNAVINKNFVSLEELKDSKEYWRWQIVMQLSIINSLQFREQNILHDVEELQDIVRILIKRI